MVNRIALKLLLAIFAIFFSALLLLYISFINTDRFLNYFEHQITSSVSSQLDNYEIKYENITGSFSSNFIITKLILKDQSSTIIFNKIIVRPKLSSNFYTFIKSIFNSKLPFLDRFIFKDLIIDKITYDNGSILGLLDNIVIKENVISSLNAEIHLSDNNINIKDIIIELPSDIYFNNLKFGDIFYNFLNTSISSVEFSNNSFDDTYLYTNIDFELSLHRINDYLHNLTSYNIEYYYNNMKYYFNIDININNTVNSSGLTINSLDVLDANKIKKIDLYGEIRFNDMHLNIKAKTNKLKYLNFTPTIGILEIKGRSYIYNIDFKFQKVNHLVDNTIDQMNGQFILNLNDSLDYLIHFDRPIEIVDKDFKGTFSISDVSRFGDIYNTSIIVGTERINPFKLHQFKKID